MQDLAAARPNVVFVLDMKSEEDSWERVRGRRVNMTTGERIPESRDNASGDQVRMTRRLTVRSMSPGCSHHGRGSTSH